MPKNDPQGTLGPARWGRRVLLATTGALATAGRARAQAWPDRPVRIVVPYAAGGGPDLLARSIAERLKILLGQPVVVDNRPGASTILATEHVANARPDGHTMLLGLSTSFVVNPHLYARLPYRVEQFQPVAPVLRSRLGVYTHPATMPTRSLSDLVAAAKARPGALSYGITARFNSTHLLGEAFKFTAGIDVADVPYRGTGPMQQDLLRGELAYAIDGISPYIALIRDGQLRALAVSGSERIRSLPDVPTITEAGFPQANISPWYGMVVPAGTPMPVVERLAAALEACLDDPAVVERFLADGAERLHGGPTELARMMAAEDEVWARLLRSINLRAE
ncbi:Bug family tripartite tricarboxylate transporter substrate binding protein [Muricoccus radiodurans]|uniref:Bug family tripartite tricarboxylate transporter substrate binding protein n=1 Tax=Muricoccus radiodurans TaxID=2231721 RepID=UPI003CEA514B